MKKAISVLLILATLLSCCVCFFACKPKDDEDGTLAENGAIKDNSTVILDFENDSNISKAGLSASSEVYDLSGATKSAKWSISANAGSRILSLDFAGADLSNAKQVSFWMNNDSQYDVAFNVYYIMKDGSEVRASANLYSQEANYPTVWNNKNIIVHPGWHEYKLALSEVEPLEDRSYAYIEPEDEDEEGEIEVRFDKSKIVGIKLDGSRINFTGSANLYITSIKASNVKSGTITGFIHEDLGHAVAFYEDANAYLYNQHRYLLHDNEKLGVTGDKKTTMVPVEPLVRHRGGTITADDNKDTKLISFNYNGKSYTFKEGDDITFVGTERGFSAGATLTVKAAMLGDYVTIPMETAAEIFGYQLFFDQMGLAVFSDKNLNEKYLPALDENYHSDADRGMSAVYNIIQIMAFKNYTGSELIDDMNEIYGEDAHTKLMLNQAQFDVLRERLETDQIYASWFNRFESRYAKGTAAYSSALPFFELSDGHRLLAMSRDVMDVLINYSFLYKMTDNEDYAIKVKKTMVACTRFIDKGLTKVGSWHPEHTLDTGEIMYGYGIAYDWCYDYLAKDKKDLKTIEDGIWELGYGAMMGFGDLYKWWDDSSNMDKHNQEMIDDGDPSTDIYLSNTLGNLYYIKDGAKYKKYNWNRYIWTNNWGAVCNGGTGVMALAFANVNTEFRAASNYLLDAVLFTFPSTLYEGYGPDGGYPEGPGYWSYGTNYSVNLIASIVSATGSDQGFTKAPGFAESFYFINGAASVAKGTWNYHDAGIGGIDGARFFWFSYQCGDKNIAGVRYNQLTKGGGCNVWDLMFYDPQGYNTTVALDLDYCYYGIGVTTFHSDWTDSALFCGLHGGANAASHGQLDIGNFILEYGGTRFFHDLGSDEYNLMGYSNGKVTYFTTPFRYWYYRNKAEGQNTLVINPVKVQQTNTSNADSGQAQKTNYDSNLAAVSDVLRFESGKTSALSVIDMGCAYRTIDKYKSAFQSQALEHYYLCPNCDYETAGMCNSSKCAGKYQMQLTESNGSYTLNCTNTACKAKISAACPNCGTTIKSERNGIRGMLVCENRTTVVIQDEMWLDVPATKIMWMGHVVEGAKVTVSDDKKSALVQADGKTLLVEIVVPEGYTGNWYFETQAADYLPETGLVMTPGEYNRDGFQKLVCIGENISEIKLAVVCKLLSSGPHNYTWTDIKDWTTDR